MPEGYVLFVNTDFGNGMPNDTWAFEIAAQSRITDTVTRILFARDLCRIGEPMVAKPEVCAGG